jgi:phage gp46-like protein
VLDIRLVQQAEFPYQTEVSVDWRLLSDGTLDTNEALATAVIVALGTNRLAERLDILPDPDSTDRQGWWGDFEADLIWNGWTIGSRLWLLRRAKITGPGAQEGATVVRVEQYIREAIQPFLELKIASQMDVAAARVGRERIDALVRLYRGPELAVELRYQVLWDELLLPTPKPAQPPGNVTPPSISGVPRVGQQLTCTNGLWIGNVQGFTFQWYRIPDEEIPNAKSSAYLVVASDDNHSLFCRVTAVNQIIPVFADSNIIGPISYPPLVGQPPLITGAPGVGHQLTCSLGTWTGVAPITYAYQWYRGDVVISGATTNTYLLTAADASNMISCRITATNVDGIVTAPSNFVGPITDLPIITAPPTITGSLLVGSILTCSTGTWSGAGPLTYYYQWLRGGATVPGATTATYLLTSVDEYLDILCRVTASNVHGAVVANSNMVGPIERAAPTLDLDFINNTGSVWDDVQALDALLTTTRASVGYAEDVVGNWTSFGPNVMRRTNKGVLIEEMRTNGIRNNSMQGAVAGTPGTLPTNWSAVLLGTSQQIIGIGAVNGIDYVDIRIFGTPNQTNNLPIQFEPGSQITAASGQVWSESAFVALVGGSLTNVGNVNLRCNWQGPGSNSSGSDFKSSLTATLKRFEMAQTAPASTTFILPQIVFGLTNAAAVDFTIRIGWPQAELGAFVTSPIRTTTAAVVRAADAILMPIGSWFNEPEGTIFADLQLGGDLSAASPYRLHNAGATDMHYGRVASDGTWQSVTMVGGVVQTNMGGMTLSANARYKFAHAYKLNDHALSVNGGTAALDASGTVPSGLTTLRFSDHTSTAQFGGYMRRFAYYPRRIPNAELQSLSVLTQQATLDLDFVANTGSIGGVAQPSSVAPLTVTRASVGYADDIAGNWSSFAANMARRTDKGVLIEEVRTNAIRNNSMQGAVAGDPGTVPTNWTISDAAAGLERTIIGTGTQNGIDYIDVRFAGTISGGTVSVVDFEPGVGGIAAAQNDVRTISAFVALVGGAVTSTGITQIDLRHRTLVAAGGGLNNFIGPNIRDQLTSALQRFAFTATYTDATTGLVIPRLAITPNVVSTVVDFTLRIGWPQLELGAFVTSPIRTMNAAVTRAADIIKIADLTWFNSVVSSLFVDATLFDFGGTRHVLTGGSASNRLVYTAAVNTSATIYNGTNSLSAAAGSGGWLTGGKVAVAFAVADRAITFNNSAVATDAFAQPALTELGLMSVAGAIGANGRIRRVTYYPRRLSNAELQALTA